MLIQGESGTGKELIARAIHHHSPRNKGPFVVLNCGSIPSNLLESELFGHVKGSFTGAIRDKKGLFEEADGGVIFLDEIGELPLEMQVKLLRAIQQREIKCIGDNRSFKIDVRIIAATNKDLYEVMKSGLFREDLYYRINVFTIKIPPLRERPEDIPLLIDYFLRNKGLKGNQIRILNKAIKILLKYSYPGNVRELENIIEGALILCEKNTIRVSDLPEEVIAEVLNSSKLQKIFPLGNQEAKISSDIFREKKIERLETHPLDNKKEKFDLYSDISGIRLGDVAHKGSAEVEKDLILKALKRAKYNKALAARILKISRASLYSK